MLAVHVGCCPAIAQIERIQESKRERGESTGGRERLFRTSDKDPSYFYGLYLSAHRNQRAALYTSRRWKNKKYYITCGEVI
jgi:hypothetical protein